MVPNWSVSRTSPWFQALVLGTSVALCLTVSTAYGIQPESWAALLILPRWLWLVPGGLLAILAWTRRRKLPAALVAALWLCYTFVFVEEWTSLIRARRWPSSEWQTAQRNGGGIRVITLNCSGSDEAAAEVGSLQPDLVLLQESPLRPRLQALARTIAGPEAEALCGPDVSIVARGRITPVPLALPWSGWFSHARVRFDSGKEVEVIVARLQPYDIRVDLWSLECWRRQLDVRRRQQAQIEWLARHIESIPGETPLIVGGDFNLPASDHLLGALRPRLRDAFLEAGSGLGNTLANDIPFLRIDQVWASDHFRAASAIVRRTVHTDHRMVVCDLIGDSK